MPAAARSWPVFRHWRWLSLFLLVCGCATQVTDVASIPAAGRQDVGVPGDGVTLGGFLHRPDGAEGARPAVIVLHGWGEAGPNGARRVDPVARELSEQGFVALALSMRGWPPSGGADDCGYRQPDDIARAAEWLAALPGVDPDRIGVLGFSQGDQVALLAAARSARIRAVVAYYPVTDVALWARTTERWQIRDSYIPRTCGSGTERSPLYGAGQIGAAVLIIHGDKDTRVPTEQGVKMVDAMRAANGKAELLLVPGAEHGFSRSQGPQAWPAATRFLADNLSPRR
jgi:dipeptidyl aminopeptidase/acylaminoacyl peptidase